MNGYLIAGGIALLLLYAAWHISAPGTLVVTLAFASYYADNLGAVGWLRDALSISGATFIPYIAGGAAFALVFEAKSRNIRSKMQLHADIAAARRRDEERRAW